MKVKFSAVLLCLGLITSPLYAHGVQKEVLSVIKASRISIKTPSLFTRVTAAVRGQTPAWRRLQRLQRIQAYQGSVTEWRARNKSLAEQLDFRGVILTKLPKQGKMVDAFSADGVTWFEADNMVVQAVKDRRFIRTDEPNGEVYFSPYKDGPEFKFYDERLFKELDRSRELGISIVKGGLAGSWHDWVGIMPEDVANVKVFLGDPAQFRPGAVVSAEPWGETILSRAPAFSLSSSSPTETDLAQIAKLNDSLSELAELGKQVGALEKRFNIGVVFNPGRTSEAVLIQDSRGMLHSPKDLKAVIQAERELSLPAIRVETPRLETGRPEVGFEEVL